MKLFFSCVILLCALTFSVFGQSSQAITSIKLEQTPTYKLLLSQKSKVTSELQELRKRFTETFADVQYKKMQLDILELEIARLYGFESTKYDLLSKCYGELILQKAEAELEIKKFLDRHTLTNSGLQQKAQNLTKLETEVANYFK